MMFRINMNVSQIDLINKYLNRSVLRNFALKNAITQIVFKINPKHEITM